ncbi:MAG: hypothetical protein ACK5MZ_08705, partial [Aestuariibaculum sp.]
MRRVVFIAFVLLGICTSAQVKIGNNPNIIDSASILELESTDKAFVLTRLTNAEMSSITPLEGALVYNTDQKCLFQYNGTLWLSLCNSGTDSQQLSFNTTTNILTLQNGGTVNLTSLINDADADATNELQTLNFNATTNTLSLSDGNTVDLSQLNNIEALTMLLLNGDNTHLDYTDENGTVNQIDLTSLVKNLETVTALVDNSNGTFSYTDEAGSTTIIDVSNLETLTSIALNTDNTNINYTDENGNTTQLNLTNLVKNLETPTILSDNNDGSITLINEKGAIFTIQKSTLLDNGDGTFTFSNKDGNNITFVPSAQGTTYSNITSGLTANNVQSAIDEIVADNTTNLDRVIGNEVTNATDATLTRSGAGTDTDPYTLDVADGGITTDELADNAVTTDKIADGTADGQLLQWNGSDWVLVDDSALVITEVDGSVTNELSDLQLSGTILTLTKPTTTGNSVDLANIIEDTRHI